MLHRAETFHFGNKPKREITAPFQDGGVSQHMPTKETMKKDFVDYSNFKFVPLEDEKAVVFEKYVGPTPESNWVIPGKLLVGAYPASQDDGETFELITSILKLGITKFVCLQLEYRTQGVTEDMWRNGTALRPYFEDVKLVVQLKASIPELNGYDIVDESKLSFVHFPIKDCGITDDGRVLELAKMLVKAISENEVIYLHCWGGHGRTGTLVCIMLHLMYGLTASEAMARCQLVHDLRQCPVQVGSPQTQPQRDQVTRIIKRLITQANSLRRTVSDVNVVNNDTGDGFEDHSPRNPSAHAITMSLTQGHGHYPIGSPGVAPPGVVSVSAQPTQILSPAAPNGIADSAQAHADDEDPWKVDIVDGYDDVDVDSDTEDSISKSVMARSFRADPGQVNHVVAVAAADGIADDIELVFENLQEGNVVAQSAPEKDGDEIREATAAPSPPGSLQPSNSVGGGGVRAHRQIS